MEGVKMTSSSQTGRFLVQEGGSWLLSRGPDGGMLGNTIYCKDAGCAKSTALSALHHHGDGV